MFDVVAMPRDKESLYRQNILDHYKHPRNWGKLDNPSASAEDSNPLCGDELAVDVLFEGGRIAKLAFSGKGCAICISSASILSDLAKNKTTKEAFNITQQQLLAEIGIDPGPSRLKCALLSLKVLKLAIAGASRITNE